MVRKAAKEVRYSTVCTLNIHKYMHMVPDTSAGTFGALLAEFPYLVQSTRYYDMILSSLDEKLLVVQKTFSHAHVSICRNG